ncbi:MAG TPA: methyltransferase domain-containing protein [Acidimicrobiia bacterium]|nr:methyltransferase domain-containing protein [Acidimicrobiia bacterium]
MPGEGLDPATMPAHWLLARLGKKVMRPGGTTLTDAMLAGLAVGPGDDVVDLAPALGDTVRRVQAAGPASFRGVERGTKEAERASRLGHRPYECVAAEPEATGLADGSASVVYGEACLSLETDETKRRILAEAARLLRPGGRLGLHELLLTPDDIGQDAKRRIETDLTRSVRVRARPLTLAEWTGLLDQAGFKIRHVTPTPMLLLTPASVIRDEGLGGALALVGRILRQPVVLRRVADLWRTMRRERRSLGAVAIVAERPG